MDWTHYSLVFHLESPLHIGYRKVGNLMQTRRYVPGKNLWAALTERIVWLAGQGNNAVAYQKVGETLQKHFRFGYLWPARATEEAGQWIPPTKPHFPWEENDPAYWDYLYLDGTARTALAGDRRTAAEGALYEVEFIAPYTREGQPVYLVGELWVCNDVPTPISVNNGHTVDLQWEEAIKALQLGGERTYGWGRITLMKCFKDGSTIWEWKKDREGVILKPKNNLLPTHALAVAFNEEKPLAGLQGPIEPWLGWEYQGQYRLSKVRILYEPGAKVNNDSFEARLHPWGYLYSNS